MKIKAHKVTVILGREATAQWRAMSKEEQRAKLREVHAAIARGLAKEGEPVQACTCRECALEAS